MTQHQGSSVEGAADEQPAQYSGMQFDVSVEAEGDSDSVVVSTSPPGVDRFDVVQHLDADDSRELSRLIRDGDAVMIPSHLGRHGAQELAADLERAAAEVNGV